MRNGTQEELDAAREDARLIPQKAFFMAKKANTNPSKFPIGKILVRVKDSADNEDMVRVELLDGSDFWFVDSFDLEAF